MFSATQKEIRSKIKSIEINRKTLILLTKMFKVINKK